VRTDNTVPLGSVEARPGSEVSNAQRLKERATKYFVINFMGVYRFDRRACASMR
jgi:hypothetical protein